MKKIVGCIVSCLLTLWNGQKWFHVNIWVAEKFSNFHTVFSTLWEITKFYCHRYLRESNSTKELYSKLIWREKKSMVKNFSFFNTVRKILKIPHCVAKSPYVSTLFCFSSNPLMNSNNTWGSLSNLPRKKNKKNIIIVQ